MALDKSPAFILGQFGLTKDNVKDKVKQTGPLEMTFEVDKAYAPTLVLYCLGNSVASDRRQEAAGPEREGRRLRL